MNSKQRRKQQRLVKDAILNRMERDGGFSHGVTRKDFEEALNDYLKLERKFEQESEKNQEMWETLRLIADIAHRESTGPAVPDAMWNIRNLALDSL